jgi:hypothetical protein
MSQRTYESDEETGRLLREAMHARAAGVVGRSDSLAELHRAYRGENSPRTVRLPRMRRLSAVIGIVATAAAVLLVVVGVNWIGRNYSPETNPTRPTHSSVPLKRTGFGYLPKDYYPAVRSDGQPVIVRVSDGQLIRVLPRGRVNASRWAPLSPMILSPDGNQLYGVGRELQDDGKPYPANWNVDHVLSIDLRTNEFTSLATRGEQITGFTLSADGTTFAFSLRGSQDGQPDRDVIYVHDLVHDTDRHLLLAAGQRTVIMALSPDGSKLAINVNSNSAAVQVISTVSGLAQPPQQLLGAAGCEDSAFGPVQWTSSGLYAVRYCSSSGASRTQTIVRLGDEPNQPATVVATTSSERTSSLLVRDSSAGLAIFTDQGTAHVVTKLGAGGQKPTVVPGIQLSGPGT